MHNGHQIPQGHGGDGERHQYIHQILAVASAQGHHPHNNGHRRHFGSSGNIGGHLVGSSLIHIRGPKMERKHRQLEEKAAEHQKQTNNCRRRANNTGKHLDNFHHIGGVGHPKNIGEAEKHHRRSAGPNHEVLDTGLHIDAMPPAQGDQNVERIAGEFQGNIDGEQLDAAYQHHHRHSAGGKEKVEFWMVSLLNAIEFGAQADYQKKAHGQHDLEDLGKEINPIGLEKEGSFQPDAGQSYHHPHAGHEQRRKIITPGVWSCRHGQAEKNDSHQQTVKLRNKKSP